MAVKKKLTKEQKKIEALERELEEIRKSLQYYKDCYRKAEYEATQLQSQLRAKEGTVDAVIQAQQREIDRFMEMTRWGANPEAALYAQQREERNSFDPRRMF